MKPDPITEEDIQGYVDDVLSEERRQLVVEYLESRADEAERVEAYRKQNDQLRMRFNPVLQEPVPMRLQSISEQALRSQSSSIRLLLRIAAGVAVVFLSGLAGWIARDFFRPVNEESNTRLRSSESAYSSSAYSADLPLQAAVAHVMYSPTVERPKEIDASQEDHLIDWLSQRLEIQVRPPKLRGLGYQLIGARMVPGSIGPIVQFMYHSSVGARVTLYVCAAGKKIGDTGFHFDQEGPVNVFYWVDGKFGYAVSSGIGKDELEQIARASFTQLEPQ